MATDKRTRYRQKMDGLGLIQANEWVPRDQRDLFRAVAAALREGKKVFIGEVPRDQAEPEVPRDPAPEAQVPRDQAEPEVPRDRKAQDAERQRTREEQWAAAGERVRMLDTRGRGYEGRVLRRESVPTKLITGLTVGTHTQVSGLVRVGNKLNPLVYEIWPDVGVRVAKPRGWRVVPDHEVTRLRKVVAELHPDRGGPGGPEFMAAKAELDAVLGRAK